MVVFDNAPGHMIFYSLKNTGRQRGVGGATQQGKKQGDLPRC